jgi:microcystin-dependent protein
MATPYVGEIRMFAGNFAPSGWMLCAGQPLSISEYDVLFNLIGTTYGGDGITTFALPNLQSRMPVHMGTGLEGPFLIGQAGGQESVALTAAQVPLHSHAAAADASTGTESRPAGNVWAASSSNSYVSAGYINTQMASDASGSAGGGQPHDNMIPYLAINFIISLFGIYPSQG